MKTPLLQDFSPDATWSEHTPATHHAFTWTEPRELFNRIDWNLQCADVSPGHRFSLLMVGIDNLWLYADCLGTHAADRLLMAVADVIARTLEPVNVPAVCRRDALMITHMGGNVLAVLLEERAGWASGAKAARQIRQALYQLNPTQGLDAFATATFGVVDVWGDGHRTHQSAKHVMRDAQAAMHHARSRGRGWSCVFEPDLRRSAASRLQLECDLRRAVNQNEFSLVYQPIVTLENGELKGFEALLRWQRPDGVFVSPAEFIPLAEETGLVWPMGEIVLQEACAQLAKWRSQHDITMNVNVSRRQFAEEGLMELVPALLKQHAIPPESLALEITESVLLQEGSTALRVMNGLVAAGIALHLDDFGTGYSSLATLHQFPVKGLKIDRSFIVSASGRRDYAAVLQAIIVLAENLGLGVVGEGVETREQVALLQSLNCPRAQGYYFGKPMAAEAATKLLTAGSLPLA